CPVRSSRSHRRPSCARACVMARRNSVPPKPCALTPRRSGRIPSSALDFNMQPSTMIPARIDPPAKPLWLLPFLRAMVRNPIEAWPRAVYREHLHRSRMPGRDAVFVMRPELIRQVLVDEADSFEKGAMARRALGPVLGDAILIAEGTRWRAQRRAPAPLFLRGAAPPLSPPALSPPPPPP